MNTEQLAMYLLDQFRKDYTVVNSVLDERWIEAAFKKQLNTTELELLEDSINLLASKGLIKIEKRIGLICLVLTQEGYDKIFL